MVRSSADYLLAAKVLEDEQVSGYVELVDDLMGKAADAKRRECYIASLGILVGDRYSPLINGTLTVGKLLEDGWTPPEGLF